MKNLEKLSRAIKFYIDKISEYNNSINNNMTELRMLESMNMYDMHKKRKRDELIKENEESMFLIENLLIDRKKFVESADIKLLQEIKNEATTQVNAIVDRNKELQTTIYALYDDILTLKEALQANNNEIIDIKKEYNDNMKIFDKKFDTKINNERILITGIDEYKRTLDNKVSDKNFTTRINKIENANKDIFLKVGQLELDKINKVEQLKAEIKEKVIS